MSELVLFAAGIAIGFMWTHHFSRTRYQKLLELCSRLETPEKFYNGKFYYIVPESKEPTT